MMDELETVEDTLAVLVAEELVDLPLDGDEHDVIKEDPKKALWEMRYTWPQQLNPIFHHMLENAHDLFQETFRLTVVQFQNRKCQFSSE